MCKLVGEYYYHPARIKETGDYDFFYVANKKEPWFNGKVINLNDDKNLFENITKIYNESTQIPQCWGIK